MKKIIIIVALLIILPVAWYLISPIFIVVERDDEVPFKEIIDRWVVAPPDMLEEIVDKVEEEEKAETGVEEKIIDEENTEAKNNKVEEEKKENKKEVETEVSSIIIPYQGKFVAAEHEVKWNAKLILSWDKAVIRFEDFETINGPDLFVYLWADLKAKDFIDLWRVKWTKWNINYEVDANIDFDKYKYVMVWCKPFRALFSYAELEKNKLIK